MGGSAISAAGWLLAVLLPFGVIRPLATIGGIQVTDEKLLLLIILVAWFLQGAAALPSARESRLVLPTLVLIVVTLISAVTSQSSSQDALSFTSRLIAALFAMLLALRLERKGFLWAIIVGASISALLGIGEALGWSSLTPLLALFKVAPTRVGGELRVSASFQYATIAAMYFEMVIPLAIMLAATAQRRWQQVLAMATAMLCTANVVLTLTRAGMLTLALVLGAATTGAVKLARWRALLLPSLVCSGVLVLGTGMLFLANPVFDMRLVTESDAEWYGAVYSVPPLITVQPDQTVRVAVDATNEGRLTWTTGGKDPFELGYRWLTSDGTGVVDAATSSVALPRDVEPGQTVRLEALVTAPDLPGGSYLLDWTMRQRNVVQFYERGWADAETRVAVVGAGGAMPPITPREDAEAPWVIGRLDLWSSAVKLFAAHPLFGVGPDNFRHLYGAELGLEGWDERVQANNVYLEILADLGAVGLVAFLWLIGPPLLAAVRSQLDREPHYLTLGALLGIAAFLIHGTLDSFLAFTPTAFLFWMLLGLAQDQKPQVSGR